MPIVIPPSGPNPGDRTRKELSDAVARWLNRTDLGPHLPDFIGMAENEMAADKRVRMAAQSQTVSGYITGGLVPIPGDLLELTGLYFEDEYLHEMTPHEFERSHLRQIFTRRGRTIHIKGEPDGNYRLVFVARLQPLRHDEDSNWLLDKHFEVYLWKCCEVGSIFLRDIEGAQGYRAKYEESANAISNSTMWQQWGGAQRQVMTPGVV